MRSRFALVIALALYFPGVHSLAEAEFKQLAETPYPAQHVNPRNSDYTPFISPTNLQLAWKALEDSSVVQGCTTDRGQLYCTLGYDQSTDRCNLVALDERNGQVLWEDRVNSRCLLDEYASLTNPMIDADGNLYVSDSQRIASFTHEGKLRWVNDTPGKLPSRKGLANAPFGLVSLVGDELATATLGDGWILFLDKNTGELTREPFDLPAEKRALERPTRAGIPAERPKGFMENLMSPSAAQLLWDFAFGESDFETDNNIALAEKHQLMFISSGAPYPNRDNTGALWALNYADDKVEVAFYVELDVEGGIATTPTINHDQTLALIGDNDENLVAVDIERCLNKANGASCNYHSSHALGHDLTSSVIITDRDLLVIPAGYQGYAAYQLSRGEPGTAQLNKLWQTELADSRIAVSVHLAFDNVVWIPIYHKEKAQPYIVALDIENGEELARYPSGNAANVTMASDGKTIVANVLAFTDTMVRWRKGQEVEAGVWAWRPAD